MFFLWLICTTIDNTASNQDSVYFVEPAALFIRSTFLTEKTNDTQFCCNGSLLIYPNGELCCMVSFYFT